MSYDLYFAPGRADRPVGLDYFRGRAHYTVENGQALYEHPDTGVHFIFEEASGSDLDPELPPTTLNLLLNLFRPRFFGAEAALEIEALVEATGALVFDPQAAVPALRPFSSSDFLSSWNASNRAAISAVLTSGEDVPAPVTRPSEELQAVWTWNHRRAGWNHELGDDVFVPAISYIQIAQMTCSAVVWPDAIPLLLPQVDVVVIGLDALRRRRRFWPFGGMTIAIARWDELITRLPIQALSQGPTPYIDLSTLLPSDVLVEFLQQLPPTGREQAPTKIAEHSILDSDSLPSTRTEAS